MITKIFKLFCVASLLTVGFIACSDDDEKGSQSTPMTINNVYLENVNDTVEKDRKVEFARLGQLLRIEGSGFLGLKKILINGYDTYFNNALMTDNNVWVTLNGDTPIGDADPELRDKIILVKNQSRLEYPFTIRAAAPSISGCSNTLPKAGETVIVYGNNLEGTNSVKLPDGTVVTSGIANDEKGKWYSFTVPASANLSVAGSITSEGDNGTAVTPTYFNDFRNFITDFDGLGELGSWSATYSADDLVDDPLGTGRGKVCQVVPDVKLSAGGLDAGSNALLWATAGNDNPNDDWSTRMTSVISENTLASNVAIQFDIYCPEPWDLTGQLEISLQNNLSNYGWDSGCTKFSSEYLNTATVWVPWLNDDGSHTAFQTSGWQTVTIPLSKFGNYNPDTATKDADKATAAAATFGKVCTDRNSGSYRNFLVLFCNSDIKPEDGSLDYGAKLFDQKIYIDNLRVVSIESITVSDF